MAAKPGTLIQTIRHDYVVNVTTAAFTELSASLDNAISEIEIFDSSGQTLQLALGEAGSEAVHMYVMPGGVDRGKVMLPKGVRLSIKAISADATMGELVINLWG